MTIKKIGSLLKSLGKESTKSVLYLHLDLFVDFREDLIIDIFIKFECEFSSFFRTFGYVRKRDEKTYIGTTWQIKFKLDSVKQKEIYTLRVALASAAQAELQV